MSFFFAYNNVFAVSEVVIYAFSRPRNRRTDRQTGGQSTGQTRLLNPAVRMRAVGYLKTLSSRHLGLTIIRGVLRKLTTPSQSRFVEPRHTYVSTSATAHSTQALDRRRG